MRVTVTPQQLEAAPGDELVFTVTISNDGNQRLAPTCTITGIDPSRVRLPDGLRILEPGASSHFEVGVAIGEEATAGELGLGVQVTDPDGLHRAATRTLAVTVGDRPNVAMETMPSSLRSRRAVGLHTVLHNRADEPVVLRLGAEADDLDVAFEDDEVVLGPGEERAVATALTPRDRSWFRELRHGALLQARGEGAPRSTPVTFTQRPLIPPLLLKIVAVLTVLAVWATAVVVVTDRLEPDEMELTKQMVAANFAAGDGSVIDARPASRTGPATVTGTVEGPGEPAGTDIVVERVAFGEQGTGDQGTTDDTDGEPRTRLAALTPVRRPAGVIAERIDTETDERGEFRISSGLRAPAFYRITALRPGFEVASQVVETSLEEPDLEVALALSPADGALSGVVTTGDGTPLGGAEVTVTDGDLIYTATSATEGQVGTWSVSGVATPATYQVIAAERGHATATQVVELEGGESRSGISLALDGGLGSIRGRVVHQGDGVGGIEVRLEGEEVERGTTTRTEDDLRGTFDLPALPFGTYQLTFSAPGWLTQTTEVEVDRGDVELSVSDLRPSTAVVEGVVTQQVAPGGNCVYPDADEPDEREHAQLRPCGGVGVTVEGDERTWRTTSSSGDGSFRVSGIEPGEYLVRFERFGYVDQIYEIEVAAGDVLGLPPGAGGPYDRDGNLLIDRTVQMTLVAPLDETAGQLQGFVSDAIDAEEPFEPPSGTEISVDGQPDAVVERLVDGTFEQIDGQINGQVGGRFTDGAFRISNLRPGAHTLRIEAPGYDTMTRVVQIAFDGLTEIGVVPITRLGSLALRITGAQSSVVPDAEVFVTPDPAVYGENGITPPDMEAAGGVTTCERTFALDGTSHTLQGMCATTDAVGDVEFSRTFSTGSYVMVTPVNEVDPGDPDSAAYDPEMAAGVLPHDHEQLVRRVDIESGGTVRLDPNLRRYPSISGAVRVPSEVDDGLEGIGEFDITFEPIDPDTGDVVDLPDGAPTFRVSGGEPEADRVLNRGEYRIDRIPADDGNASYSWRLIIESNRGAYVRDLGQPEGRGPIDGLTFNESRTINALLLPEPQELNFELVWENANGDELAVPDARLQVRGTYQYEELDDPPYFRSLTTVCPGDACGGGELGFDFTDAAGDPQVQDVGGELWLFTDVEPPPGGLTVPPFFRPGDVFVDIVAPGFEEIRTADDDPDAQFELEVPECERDQNGDLVDPSCDPDDPPAFVRQQHLEVIERDIVDTVALRPVNGNYGDLTGLEIFGAGPDFEELTADADILDGLTVELLLDGSVVDTFDLSSPDAGVDGRFRFADRTPGEYELRITGDHIDDLTTAFTLEPGVGDAGVDADARTVDRRGLVHVDLDGQVLNAQDDGLEPSQLGGVELTLERADGAGGWTPVDDLETCDAAGAGDGGPDCAHGLATFTDLPIYDASGAVHSYRLTRELQGYRTETSVFDLATTPYYHLADSLQRYGEVRGNVQGQIGAGTPFDLEDATITLLDAAGTPVSPQVQVTTDADGDFVFGPELGIDPAPLFGLGYGFRIGADGYTPQTLLHQQPFAYDSFETHGTTVLDALPANVVGTVTGPSGEVMHSAAGGGNVTVSLRDPVTGDVVLDELGAPYSMSTTTGATQFNDPYGSTIDLDPGSFAIQDVDAGQYEIRFEPDSASFRRLEVPLDLDPGTTVQLDEIQPYAQPTLQGTVLGEDFAASGDAQPLEDVQVTLTSDPDGETFETTTDANGDYEFDTVPEGTYELLLEFDGYEDGFHGAVYVPGPLDPAAVQDETLVATEVDVEVTVTSTDSSFGALDGVDVAATYLGPVNGTTPSQHGDVVATDTNGTASFELPPGNWRFEPQGVAAADFDDPHPHVVEVVEPGPDDDPPNVPLATEGATTPVTFDLDLDPYRRVTGTVTIPDNGGTQPADGVSVSVVDDQGSTITDGVIVEPATTDAADGAVWTVLLDGLPTDVDPDGIALRFELEDYRVDDQPLADSLFDTSLDADLGAIAMTRDDREVELELTSVLGGDELVGLELEAERTTDSSDTVTATVQPGDYSGGSATVTFEGLVRGESYDVSTTNAGSLPVPHVAASDVALSVDTGPGDQSEADFIEWLGEVRGTVRGRDHADASSSRLGGATVTVVQGTSGTSPSVQTTADGAGDWEVGVLTLADGTIDVDADGYDAEIDVDYAFPDGGPPGDRDLSVVDVTLDAAPRDLVLTLTTPEGPDGDVLDGLALTATPTHADLTPVDTTVASLDGGDTAQATFQDLAPDDWTVAVASSVTDPDYLVDLDVTVVVGVGDVTRTLDFALLQGVVEGRNYDNEAQDDWVTLSDVTVTAQQGSTEVATTSAGNGTWSLGVGASTGTSLDWTDPAGDYQGDDHTLSGPDVDGIVDGAAVADVDTVLTATPVEVTVTVLDDDGTGSPDPTAPIEDATVAVSSNDVSVFDPPVPADGTTDQDGEVVFQLAPGGEWRFDANTDSTNADPVFLTVAAGDGSLAVEMMLAPNSKLTGTVAEQRGDDLVALSGVQVAAEQPERTFRTTSTEPNDNGDNYLLQARAGSWRITATRSGETTVVAEDFTIEKDPGSEPTNRLDIVLPSQTIDMDGVVVDADGAPIEGASVTARSTVGEVSVTTDVDGRYTLEGLDNRVTWAVTFAPPEEMPGSPVTRYVELSGDTSIDLALDQTIPTALGEIELEITGGAPDVPVAVELTEQAPFPTLNAEGRLSRDVRLNGDGEAVVLFEHLVPGDGRSIPQNRFSLAITAEGYHPAQRAGLDVTPGGTTTVAVDLGEVGVLTRDVELTLYPAEEDPDDTDTDTTSADASDATDTADTTASEGDTQDDLVDRTVWLEDETRRLTGTVASGSTVYSFSNVEPGKWRVVVDGFEPAAVTIPPGDPDELVRREVTLERTPEDPDPDATSDATDDLIGSDSESEPGAGSGTSRDEQSATDDGDQPPDDEEGDEEGAASGDSGTDGGSGTEDSQADDSGTDEGWIDGEPSPEDDPSADATTGDNDPIEGGTDSGTGGDAGADEGSAATSEDDSTPDDAAEDASTSDAAAADSSSTGETTSTAGSDDQGGGNAASDSDETDQSVDETVPDDAEVSGS